MSKGPRTSLTTAALAVILASCGGLLVIAGVQIAWAASGSATLDNRLAVVLDQSDQPLPDFNSLLAERQAFARTPGVRAQARKELVMLTALVGGIPDAQFESTLDETLAALLSVEPAAPAYWAVLADLRADRGDDAEGVRSAFRMSAMVERLESTAMAQRVETGIRVWELLGPEERDIMVNDLIGLRPRLSREQLDGIATLALEKSDETRAEIRAAIEARIGTDAWIDQLGV